MPVSVRTPEQLGTGGNQISFMLSALPTDEPPLGTGPVGADAAPVLPAVAGAALVAVAVANGTTGCAFAAGEPAAPPIQDFYRDRRCSAVLPFEGSPSCWFCQLKLAPV